MDVVCPIACVRQGCPTPDFLERNGPWLLTVIGLLTGCIATMLSYFLKSRCKNIKCCGAECVREVVTLEARDARVSLSGGSQTEVSRA